MKKKLVFLLILIFVFHLFPSNKKAENIEASVPRFAVNNAFDLKLANELGVELVRQYPFRWFLMEPLPPQKRKEDFKDPHFAMFKLNGMGTQAASIVRSMIQKWKNKFKKRIEQHQYIQYNQDKDGLWHLFIWDITDHVVQRAQAYGLDLMLSIEFDSFWASDIKALEFRLTNRQGFIDYSCPLRNESYAKYISFFMEAMAERYDGDGINDMPGLKSPLVYWQNGAEYNARRFWQGSNEEYLVIWKAFVQGIRRSFKDAGIVSNGISDIKVIRDSINKQDQFSAKSSIIQFVGHNWWLKNLDKKKKRTILQTYAEIPDGNDTIGEILSKLATKGLSKKEIGFLKLLLTNRKRSIAFLHMVLRHPELYDVFDARIYTFYKVQRDRIPKDFSFIRHLMEQLGYQKPIMPTEGSGAFLGDHGEYPSGLKIHYAIKNPDHPQHRKWLKWHRSFQAKELIKVYTTLFANGVDGFVWYYFSDIPSGGPWSDTAYGICGLISVNERGKLDYPKPSFYTYKIMTRKLKGFISSEQIAREQIKFIFADKKPVYVLWAEGKPKRADLSGHISANKVKITHIVTELDDANKPVYQKVKIVAADTIPINDSPVFAEEIP
jgi:hypothetical protein